jgi:hypothetical protein
MSKEEIEFASGESKQKVVRVGDTVRKELAGDYELVRKVMVELTKNGFQYSPKYLGVDDKGREKMEYIHGKQMNHGDITISLMKQTLRALRNFHDILSVSELSEDEETLLHTDFAPWNLIVDEGKLVGVIDFDGVKPGRRLYDVAYTCWNLLDIGSSETNFTEEEVFKYLPVSINAYGDIDSSDFVDVLLSEQYRILKERQERVGEVEEGEEREYRKGICIEINKQIQWVKRNRDKIDKVLRVR